MKTTNNRTEKRIQNTKRVSEFFTILGTSFISVALFNYSDRQYFVSSLSFGLTLLGIGLSLKSIYNKRVEKFENTTMGEEK